MKDPLFFIEHILENINDIEKFLGNLSKEKIVGSTLRQKAIIRSLEVIGEAVKNIPPEFREKYPLIKWARIAGLRDKLIHHYFGIDFDIIWDVITVDLPLLKREIIKIRKELL